VLSGATDLEGLPPPEDMKEPMRWMLQGFAGEGVRRIELRPGNVEQLLPAADRRPDRPEAEPAGGDAQPELGLAALPAPRALPVSRLSYTSLESYRRCSYRFYLERALRLPRTEPPRAAEPLPNAGLSALLRGTLVHELLEDLDFHRPIAPSEAEVAQLIESHGAVVRAGEVADLRDMVERFVAGGLFERIARAHRVRTELPFAFTLTPPSAGGRSLLLNGVVDVHAAEDSGLLVVDYKSDALEGRDPVELTAGSYATQRLVYALAGLRSGAERVEVVHCYLERPDDLAAARFEAADLARLEGELLELARGVVDGRFEPTAEPHRELCADCPGRPALCSWSEDRTLADD
jgi:RecB family exonuclease